MYVESELRSRHTREDESVSVAKVRVIYWKEVPVQVQAEDESGRISKQLDSRFQAGVDAISMFDGSSGSEEYMLAWEWGDEFEVDGEADQAVDEVARRFNERFPQDFVSRIADLERAKKRDPRAGAVDDWAK